MAHNNGYGNYDPRYDPRYQQQAYGYPRQPNLEVRVPMIANSYNVLPQYQALSLPPVQQHNYHQVQANHGYQQPYSPYVQQSSPQAQARVPQYQHQHQHQQQQHHHHQHQHHQQAQPILSPQQVHQQQQLQQQLQQQHVPSPQYTVPSPRTKGNGHASPKTTKPKVPPKDRKQQPTPCPRPRPHPQLVASPITPAAPSPKPLPDIDYALLLIDLAEEYFGVAYGTKGSEGKVEDRDSFCKLISTGLGCLEISMKERKSSLQPSVEAAMRFRYSSILYQETENYSEAEETLSKGISLCERYRLNDLKYNMQHLLTRVTYATNRRAAPRYLDGVIKDVEAVQHVPWIYAMRFLRVSLALKMSQTQEALTAISQLKVIASLANSRGDHAISVMASSLEALVHMNRAINLDGIEQAQRALALARSSQFDPQSQKIPQLSVIQLFIDLCCSIHQGDSKQAAVKLVAMQTFMDERPTDEGWSENGFFSVPIGESSARTLQNASDSKGIVLLDGQGRVSLQVQWLSRAEIYTLGYTLCSSALISKNAQDGQRAEKFIQEAVGMLDRNERGDLSSDERLARTSLRCHMQAQFVFALALRSAWSSVGNELSVLKEMTSGLSTDESAQFEMLLQFLEASMLQANGDTDTALSIYGRPIFTLGSRSAHSISPFQHNLCIIAALNSLLIIHDPSHRAHSQHSSILQAVEPLALDNSSKDIHGAYYLVRAITQSTDLLDTKRNLQSALQAAKHSANNQVCCITLNFMSWKFFRGVVGEQPKKSSLSAQSLARKGQSNLWTSVADGLLAETLDTQGMSLEADKAKREAREMAEKLPKSMQREVDMGGLDAFLT